MTKAVASRGVEQRTAGRPRAHLPSAFLVASHLNPLTLPQLHHSQSDPAMLCCPKAAYVDIGERNTHILTAETLILAEDQANFVLIPFRMIINPDRTVTLVKSNMRFKPSDVFVVPHCNPLAESPLMATPQPDDSRSPLATGTSAPAVFPAPSSSSPDDAQGNAHRASPHNPATVTSTNPSELPSAQTTARRARSPAGSSDGGRLARKLSKRDPEVRGGLPRARDALHEDEPRGVQHRPDSSSRARGAQHRPSLDGSPQPRGADHRPFRDDASQPRGANCRPPRDGSPQPRGADHQHPRDDGSHPRDARLQLSRYPSLPPPRRQDSPPRPPKELDQQHRQARDERPTPPATVRSNSTPLGERLVDLTGLFGTMSLVGQHHVGQAARLAGSASLKAPEPQEPRAQDTGRGAPVSRDVAYQLTPMLRRALFPTQPPSTAAGSHAAAPGSSRR